MPTENTDTQTINFDDPKVKAVLEEQAKKIADESLKGIVQNRDELKNEKLKLQEQLKRFEGIDPDKVRTMLDHIEKSEDAKLLSEGKFEEIIEKKISETRNTYESQLAELKKQNEVLNDTATKATSALQRTKLSDILRNEAIKQGALPEAIDDIIERGLKLYTLSETGEAEARNEKGELIKDEDKYVLTPTRFIVGLKKNRPYYWPGSEGSGLTNSDSMGAMTDAEAKLQEYAAKGDMKNYRKLRAAMAEGKA